MAQESKKTTPLADYPVSLFQEPRDHANQWDVSVLFPKPESRESKRAHSAHRARRSRDHANLWDVSVLWPDSKPKSRHAD